MKFINDFFKRFLNSRENEFVGKLFLWAIFFTILMIISGLFIHNHTGLNGVKLDGQTIATLIATIFASAVPIAGALIVIKIAGEQERLTQLTHKISDKQAAIARKQTANYHVTFESASQAFQAIKDLLTLSALIYQSSYRMMNNHEKLFHPSNSVLYPLLQSLNKLLTKSWYVTVS